MRLRVDLYRTATAGAGPLHACTRRDNTTCMCIEHICTRELVLRVRAPACDMLYPAEWLLLRQRDSKVCEIMRNGGHEMLLQDLASLSFDRSAIRNTGRR